MRVKKDYPQLNKLIIVSLIGLVMLSFQLSAISYQLKAESRKLTAEKNSPVLVCATAVIASLATEGGGAKQSPYREAAHSQRGDCFVANNGIAGLLAMTEEKKIASSVASLLPRNDAREGTK